MLWAWAVRTGLHSCSPKARRWRWLFSLWRWSSCAPLNPAYSAGEFDFYLAGLDAKALIIEAGIDSPARTVAYARGLKIIELYLCRC